MSSPLTFIPRKLTRPKSSLRPATVSKNAEATSLPTAACPTITAKEKGKDRALDEDERVQHLGRTKTKQTTKFTDEDHASLVCLALSDYALWSDADLRRRIDQGQLQAVALGEESGEGTGNATAIDQDAGYIPLSYLIKHSHVLSPILTGIPETTIIRAIRTYAADFIDVRLLFAAPSSSGWYRDGSGSRPSQGGYEVRRKDWATACRNASSTYSRSDWKNLTVYMENIPIQYRSIPGICRFTQLLLAHPVASKGMSDHPSPTRVQHVSLPPHHQDNAGDQPVCKGFALVTLQTQEDVEKLVQVWNWDRDDVNDETGEETEIAKEALKFGFRTLPKARWDELKAEYLLYRTQLVDEINKFQDKSDAALGQIVGGTLLSMLSDGEETRPLSVAGKTKRQSEKVAELDKEGEEGSTEHQTGDNGSPVIDQWSPYPYGCLLFAKNVHPETNKTTLRALFSQASKAASCLDNAGDALDYVDFNKGMDTCYLRVSTPAHARLISQHFTQNPTVQDRGLDGSGTSLSSMNSGMKPVIIEMVEGTKEEVYWQKVPDKVRRQAVEKVILALSGGTGGDGGKEDIERDAGRQRKKRRKR